MQQQVDVQFEVSLEEVHKLVRLELGLKQVFDGDLTARPGYLDMAARALDREHADLVARDGEIDLVQVPVDDPRPRHEDAPLGEGAGAVLVRPELRDAAAALELALVVVLFGEGEEEALFAAGRERSLAL